ncbi:MAG: efflux RND transporter periplasmic adaptor subunit [Verrucomicrobiales bacterium]
MAGDAVSEWRDSAGLPRSAPDAEEALRVRALRPEDSLGPLAELFSRAGDRTRFLDSLCEYVRLLLGASAVILHELEGGGENVLAGFSGAAETDRRAWLPSAEVLEKVFAERRGAQGQVLVGGRQHARLMVPFFVHGGAPLCLTAYLPPERIAFVDPCFTMLHLVTQFVVQRELVEESRERELAFNQATMLVAMFSRTAEADTFKRAIFTLATELEKFFGCQRVAIGTGSSRSCRVHAVSGMSSEEKRTLGFSQIGAAMKEAIALGEIMVWPAQRELLAEVVVSANHDDLLYSFKSGRIILIPLIHEESNVSGAVALLWPAASPEINKRTYRLVEACQSPLAALVGFLKKSKPGAVRGGLIRYWRSSAVKRVASGVLALAVLVALVFPVTYRVSAESRIQPVLRRTVAAPFENRLYRTHVKPGDSVEAGDVLAELDGREIRVALAEAIAARNAAVKKRDNAMVLEDPATFQMAQLEADRLALEVERLQYRSDNLLVRSPIDGVVLTGDLERSEGVPVTSGQKLFEIAPLEKMLMEVAVPETEIRHVEKGAKVKLRLESDSRRTWDSTLENLYPISEIQDGKNVFVAEAVLENENEILRPGMRGSVRIYAGKKPFGWILFHQLWEYLRLKLW